MAKLLESETIEALLAAQGVSLAPGRGEKLAAGLNALLGVSDPLRDTLELETDPTTYLDKINQ